MNIFCVKCRKKTPTDNLINVVEKRSMMKGTCADCGTKKTVFVAKSQAGGADIDVKLSSEAYKPVSERAAVVDGYVLDKGLSNKKTLVYNNPTTKDTIVSHKGTDPKDKNDLKNDLLLSVGKLGTSKRVKNATEITRKAEAKYEGDTSHTGHSLGFAVASKVVGNKATSVDNSKLVGYSGAVSPLDISKNLKAQKQLKKNPESIQSQKLAKLEYNTTVYDPVAISGALSLGKQVKKVKPTSINTHSLSNYQKGGCMIHKKCKCTV